MEKEMEKNIEVEDIEITEKEVPELTFKKAEGGLYGDAKIPVKILDGIIAGGIIFMLILLFSSVA